MVWVTNNSDADHVDSHGGVTFRFKVGQAVEVPDNVATDLLGYGHTNKEQFAIRLGWSRTNTDMPQALEKLSKFEFSSFSQNRYLPSAVNSVTPFPDTGRGRKVNARVA